MSYPEAFTYAVGKTLKAEDGSGTGILTNDKYDPGGKTKYGITEDLATHYGYDVEKLTEDQAIDIYYREFWTGCHLDRVKSQYIAAEVFDSAVNLGQYPAMYIAQLSCILMGERVGLDGRVGTETADAMNSLSAKYEEHLLLSMNGFQFLYYVTGKDEFYRTIGRLNLDKLITGWRSKFIRGWMLRLRIPVDMHARRITT
jgi:lysozyme family protein